MTEGQHHFERSENIIPHLCGHKRTMLRQVANDEMLRINDVALRANGILRQRAEGGAGAVSICKAYARRITPQFRTIRVRFEVLFYSVNPYDIRLFATFILKIFLYLRFLIFDESAAAFEFTVTLEPHMCGLDCRNSTFPRIYPVFDSGGGNEVFQNCKKRCNYAHR